MGWEEGGVISWHKFKMKGRDGGMMDRWISVIITMSSSNFIFSKSQVNQELSKKHYLYRTHLVFIMYHPKEACIFILNFHVN